MLNQLPLIKFTPDYFQNQLGQSEFFKITFMDSKWIKISEV